MLQIAAFCDKIQVQGSNKESHLKKTIGILGGMGPAAAVHMFDLIIKLTKAGTDQEHIPVIIVSNPEVPDRTAAILHGGPSPLPLLVEGAKKLESAGAGLIIMPCNTAHYYYDKIIPHINIPFLHLQREAIRYIIREKKDLKRFGLTATTGTIETGLYQGLFDEAGLALITPGRDEREKIMESIYGEKGLKSGFTEEPHRLLIEVIEYLKARGAEAIVAGCSEISFALNAEELGLPVIDPVTLTVKAAIKEAGYEIKE